MSTSITRHFDSRAQAEAAAAKLRRSGFHPAAIGVLGRSVEAAAGDAPPNYRRELEAAGVSPRTASVFAAALARGGAAVTVEAPFGNATTAMSVLRQAGGRDLGARDTYRPSTETAAPLSSLLGLSVLSQDPAPLSRRLGLSVLSRRQQGRAGLLRTAAPLSRSFGLPLLTRARAAWRRSFGFPLLSNEPAPLSRQFSLKLLTTRPSPFSLSPPLPSLSQDPAPLSRAFGLPVLWR